MGDPVGRVVREILIGAAEISSVADFPSGLVMALEDAEALELAEAAPRVASNLGTLAATARRSDRPVEDVARALLAAVTERNSGSAAPEQPLGHDHR